MPDFDLPEIRLKVNAFLQDDAKFITEAERNQAIDMALLQLNHDRPQRKVEDITGDGTKDYDMPTSFQKGFSDIKTVEHPAGENPPVFKERDDDWIEYENPTLSPVLRLLFVSVTPTASETIRVTYTTAHDVTETASTLNLTTFAAIVAKSLSTLFKALGARFAQTTDPTIEADAVDYGGRSQNFLFLAERWESDYKKIVGFDDESLTPAQALAEADVIFSHGEDMLFHPRRTR